MILLYRIHLLVLLTISISSHEMPSFEGKEHWYVGLDSCQTARNGPVNRDFRCYWILDRLNVFKVEVLSESPLLLRYHQMIHRRHCKRLVDTVSEMQLKRASVVPINPDSPPIVRKNRMANSTWIEHRELVSFNDLFNKLQRTLLSLDLSRSESFQVLSYDKNGHYAPHYDFLDEKVSSTVKVEGNRVATVLAILQTAKKGGTTTFPHLGVNVRPNVGDVLVWHNMGADGLRDYKSLHAACPILEGTKIGATLWVRQFGQELRLLCNNEKQLSISRYLDPSPSLYDIPLFAKEPGPE